MTVKMMLSSIGSTFFELMTFCTMAILPESSELMIENVIVCEADIIAVGTSGFDDYLLFSVFVSLPKTVRGDRGFVFKSALSLQFAIVDRSMLQHNAPVGRPCISYSSRTTCLMASYTVSSSARSR